MAITDEQKKVLQSTTLDSGMNAWDFVQSRSADSQPWGAAGILSCIAKGYHLNLMMVGWEARDLRSAADKRRTSSLICEVFTKKLGCFSYLLYFCTEI